MRGLPRTRTVLRQGATLPDHRRTTREAVATHLRKLATDGERRLDSLLLATDRLDTLRPQFVVLLELDGAMADPKAVRRALPVKVKGGTIRTRARDWTPTWTI